MSFGFSVSDFLEVAKLVESTRKRFKGAPVEYNVLADETRTLQIVVSDLKLQIEDDEIADPIKRDLRSAMNNCETVLKDLNTVIDAHTELDSANAAARKTPRRIWKRLRWDPHEADRLRSRLKSSIQLLVAIRQRLDSALQRDMAQDLAKLTITHDNDGLQRVADWLAPGTYSEHQHDYFAKVQTGTGQWVLTEPLYCNWLESRGPATLLLPGIPGAGKTFVASVIINGLQIRVSQVDSSALVFFYSSYKRTATQSCLHIVSSMVRQLYLQKPHSVGAVKTVYEEHSSRQPATFPNLEEMCATLEKLLLGFSMVIFVIDALDECKGPKGSDDRPWKYILTLMFQMQKKLEFQVAIKVLATSRPDLEIDGFFQKEERLTIYARDDDIGKFCGSLIPNIRCIAQKTELHSKVKEAICESARGMFLLAKLHCDTLAAKTKPKDVLQALKTFGRGDDALDRAYQDTLQRIQSQPEEHRALAKKVLVCVTYSARPLTLDEVRHALAVDGETTELDLEYDLDNPDDMISTCAGLVTVDSESNIIRLVHYTTQGFLESLGNQLMSNPHDFFANCCLNYLHLDVFAKGHTSEEWLIYEREFPFFKYSAQYWNWHILPTSESSFLRQRAFSFLDSNRRVEVALQFLANYIFVRGHGQCALHFLAFMGLNDWITDYIGRGRPTDRNADDKVLCSSYRESITENTGRLAENATSWAKVLTSWCDSRRQTPLCYAIIGGHAPTASLLIDLNNEILDDQDNNGRTPLNLALACGVEAVALRILEEPEMISWYHYQDHFHRTYLHLAARRGQEAVVDRLLELVSAFETSEAHNVEDSYTTSRDKRGITPLFEAALNGHLGIVKKLLAYSGGRELNVPDYSGRTPLHGAASYRHLKVVQYLMTRENIQAGILDNRGMSALHWAAERSKVPVLRYLLSTGFFSANSKSLRGRTALSYAAGNGKQETVLYLTSREDVDVDCTDESGKNALMYAAREGQADIIAHLAPLVHDVNSTDASGNTALHHLTEGASYREDFSRFQSGLDSLVRNGALLDVKNKKGQTPYGIMCHHIESAKRSQDRETLEKLKLIMESYMSTPTDH